MMTKNKIIDQRIGLLLSMAILLFSFMFTNSTAIASDLANGAKVFQENCNGCHVKGGNIVRRGKNLKLRTLMKNKLDSVDAIAELVSQGKNSMSAYQDRLNNSEIEDVAAYVFNRAKENWK